MTILILLGSLSSFLRGIWKRSGGAKEGKRGRRVVGECREISSNASGFLCKCSGGEREKKKKKKKKLVVRKRGRREEKKMLVECVCE
jgi:hypothetical protein